MVIEVSYSTGLKAICGNCRKEISESQWFSGLKWHHKDDSEYCEDAPKDDPEEGVN